jgi:hypothetical protein
MAATAVMAGVPTAGNSTLGTPIIIGRAYSGSPSAASVDQSIPKVIIVRDAANNPVPNSVVVLNFAACNPDIRIGSTQVAGIFVNCAAKTISGVTDATGTVTFRIVGASNTTNGSDGGAPEGCCTVTADGVALGVLSVAMPDLNGARGSLASDPGLDGSDTLQYASNRFVLANYRPRANFIFNNPGPQAVDGQDTLAFALFRFGVGRNSSAGGTGTNGPFCP